MPSSPKPERPTQPKPPSGVQLGIDTGGTYTDAVLVAAGEVLSAVKRLTTSYDLSIGIGEAVRGLPESELARVNLVALSTTLTTNSVVEGRGAPVSVLLPGYTDAQVARSGLWDIIAPQFISVLDGGYNAVGAELRPLDLARAETVIAAHAEQVSAFAVSSLFATRNPAHENELRELIISRTQKPVACGHELASGLGAPRRALTTALNARMILYIQNLITAVEQILAAHKISTPLMLVKGDGSLVNADTARRQPVATVLSGPAASVLGACALSGCRNAMVVDMGGTTTDIAIVTDGQPELCEDGARIGHWQPMVEAIRVFSVGLGGDSEVGFRGKLWLSNRRVVPMSLLGAQYPQVVQTLRGQLALPPSPRHCRFALRLQHNAALLGQLDDVQIRAWQLLQGGPVELESLIETDRPLLRALAALERMGLAIYSGFTPSDATHVLGMSSHWNPEAAELGAQLWARKMRYLYGYGNWAHGDIEAPCREVVDLVIRGVTQKLIEAGLNCHGKLSDSTAQNLTQLLSDIILHGNERRVGQARAMFGVRFADSYPLVAVGGPAQDYFPEVARRLGVELVSPPNAATANAVGAALGRVTQACRITVTQPEFGVFYVFHGAQPLRFENLDAALKKARTLAGVKAKQLATAAGATEIKTRLAQRDNHVRHDIDGELFVSTTVTAYASGVPQTDPPPM